MRFCARLTPTACGITIRRILGIKSPSEEALSERADREGQPG